MAMNKDLEKFFGFQMDFKPLVITDCVNQPKILYFSGKKRKADAVEVKSKKSKVVDEKFELSDNDYDRRQHEKSSRLVVTIGDYCSPKMRGLRTSEIMPRLPPSSCKCKIFFRMGQFTIKYSYKSNTKYFIQREITKQWRFFAVMVVLLPFLTLSNSNLPA